MASALDTLAYTILTMLNAEAQKDDRVLHGYVDLLIRTIEKLNENCKRDQEHFRQAALYRVNWPVIYSPNSSLGTDTNALNEMLEIGECFLFDLTPEKGRAWSINTPVNKIVYELIVFIWQIWWDHRAGKVQLSPNHPFYKTISNLPPPRKFAAQAWADAIWAMIMSFSDGHPEDSEDFAELGKSRDRGKGDARAKIKERIQNAIIGLMENNRVDRNADFVKDWMEGVDLYSKQWKNPTCPPVREIINNILDAESPLTWAQRTMRLMMAFANNVPPERLETTVLAFDKPLAITTPKLSPKC